LALLTAVATRLEIMPGAAGSAGHGCLEDSQDADIGGGDFEQSTSQAAPSAWRTEALPPVKSEISPRYKRSAAQRNPSKGLTNTVGIGGHPLRPEQA
jgi:hypothetical protein